jgi:hypothetical protein
VIKATELSDLALSSTLTVQALTLRDVAAKDVCVSIKTRLERQPHACPMAWECCEDAYLWFCVRDSRSVWKDHYVSKESRKQSITTEANHHYGSKSSLHRPESLRRHALQHVRCCRDYMWDPLYSLILQTPNQISKRRITVHANKVTCRHPSTK